MIKVSILAPVHNEQGTLKELTERVNNIMNKCCSNSWELMLIDDKSTDNSLEIMKKLKEHYKNIVVIPREKKGGQAGCFETGVNNARGEIVVTIDADLQVQPESIPMFLEKIDKGYDLVNGIREHRKDPFWIKLASRIYNIFMLMFFDSPVMDAASNFTAIKTKYVKGIRLRGNDHRYIIPIALRRGAKKIGELIIEHKGRESGKSKYKALPKYIKGFPEIFLAWFRIKLGFYDKKDYNSSF